MKILSILLIATALLSGCSSVPVTEVKVPVMVKCDVEVPQPFELCVPKDQSRFEFTKCTFVDDMNRKAYVKQLEALKACVK